MRKTYVFYIIIILFIIGIGIIFGSRLAGILGIIGLGGAGVKKRSQDKSEKLSEEKEDIENEIKALKEKAKKLRQASEDRSQEVAKIENKIDELKRKDKDRINKANDLNGKIKDLLIIFILIPGLLLFFTVPGLALEAEVNQEEVNEEITIDDVSIPTNYDDLLDQHKEVLKIMFEWRNLYFQERKDKIEAVELAEKMTELYEEEKQVNKELYKIVEKLETKTDRLIKIVETHEELLEEVLNSQSGGIGAFTGINYTPAYPLQSGIMAGISVNF